jgi:3',5'-cyclic AMP phosphodiesterase CpdA
MLGAIAGCSDNEQGHLRAPEIGEVSLEPLARQRFDERARKTCNLEPTGRERTLDRMPYLQSVSSSRAELLWTSDAEGRFKLHWWRSGTGSGPLSLAIRDVERPAFLPRQYKAIASGLQAKQAYCYELLLDDEPVFRGYLRTAPEEPNSQVHAIVSGDLGKDSPDQRAVREVMEELESDLWLVTGDVAYDFGRIGEFERHFFSVYRDYLSLVPVFPASGNHDYATDEAATFREVFSLPRNGGEDGRERWYSFDWGPLHVAVLDTERELEAQARWLREDLSATKRPWKLVVLHRPPYSSGSHGPSVEVRTVISPVLEEMKVDLVLAGHEHHYERTKPIGGVHYLITGGGGRGTRPVGSSDFTAFAARVAHLLYLEADGTHLRVRAVDATGQEFDGLELRHE